MKLIWSPLHGGERVGMKGYPNIFGVSGVGTGDGFKFDLPGTKHDIQKPHHA